MKNKLIKWLGGITQEEMRQFKGQCCDFASEAIKSKAKYLGNDQTITNIDLSYSVALVGKRVTASNLFLRLGCQIKVAPWVQDSYVGSISHEYVDGKFTVISGNRTYNYSGMGVEING